MRSQILTVGKWGNQIELHLHAPVAMPFQLSSVGAVGDGEMERREGGGEVGAGVVKPRGSYEHGDCNNID